VLVVPKLQVDEFFELPEEDYLALMVSVKMIAKHMKARLKTRRVGIQVIGLDVPHAHIHIIAFDELAEFRQLPDESLPPDHTKLAALAQKLAMSLY
jgi:histidine triad (HIT) family protein